VERVVHKRGGRAGGGTGAAASLTVMANDVPRALRELAELQRGVICRSQALACGLSDQAVRCRVDSGRWQRLHTGVYTVFTGAPDRQARLWAALLRAGPGSALSFQTAAELDGLLDKPASLIHVTIPATRRITAIRGVSVHTRLNAERARHPVRLPPRTRLEETVFDLTDSCDDLVAAMHWVSSALGRRLTTQAQLRDAAAQRPQLRWRRAIDRALSPDQAGVNSALEFRYLHDVERPHQLPASTRQAPAVLNGRSAYRDVLYEEYGLIVELDGKAAHPGDSRWLDISRDNAAVATGLITLRYGHLDLTRRPCLVAAQVADVLHLRGWPGHPRRCSRTCPIS
jgi:hypothetical protein